MRKVRPGRLFSTGVAALTALSALALAATPASAAAVCPPVGADSGCGTIITITDKGATVTSTGQGPYDSIEDTLVGVVNNSKLPIGKIGLKSSQRIFGFDGDGIVAYGVPGNAKDPTGYGGPNAYFTNIDSSRTAGTVNFITKIAAGGGTAYFSLEEAISNAFSCQDLINGSVKTPTVAGGNIDTTFTPKKGFTIKKTADFCGFVNFDWVQKITRSDDPSAFYARNVGGAFDASVTGPVNLTSARVPYSDPPKGGGYTYTASPDNSYPFYYDAKSVELASHQTGGVTMTFHDAPSDPCLPGGAGAGTAQCMNKTEPAGSFAGFTTHLAGVRSDGSAKDLGIGFTWTSNYNGTTGGVAIRKTDVAADGNGTGGTTVTSERTTTDYDYNGVTVTTIDGAPVGCDQTVTGTVGAQNLGPGEWCLNNASVGGGLTIQPGASVTITGSQIQGPLTSTGATQLRMCGTRVAGTVLIDGSTGPVLVGDTDAGCATNDIAGNATIRNNTGGFDVSSNRFTRSVTVDNNTGGDPSVAGTHLVAADQIAGTLGCSANNPAPTNGGRVNTANGGKTGQCGSL